MSELLLLWNPIQVPDGWRLHESLLQSRFHRFLYPSRRHSSWITLLTENTISDTKYMANKIIIGLALEDNYSFNKGVSPLSPIRRKWHDITIWLLTRCHDNGSRAISHWPAIDIALHLEPEKSLLPLSRCPFVFMMARGGGGGGELRLIDICSPWLGRGATKWIFFSFFFFKKWNILTWFYRKLNVANIHYRDNKNSNNNFYVTSSHKCFINVLMIVKDNQE